MLTVVSGNVETLSLLYCLARLELDLPCDRTAVSGWEIKAVLLWLCRSAVLTGVGLTHSARDGVTPLSGHTLTLLLGNHLRHDEALLGGNGFTIVGRLSLSEAHFNVPVN